MIYGDTKREVRIDFYHCRVLTVATNIYVQTPRKSEFCIIGPLLDFFGHFLKAIVFTCIPMC